MIQDKVLKSVEKPGRYIGGEYGEIIKNKEEVKCRFAFCFPDTYEIGMSNLGVRILYGSLNRESDIWCERVYAPWGDMEEKMREQGIPLFAHESHDPIKDFDVVAFTLQYELCYSNVLNMLELAGIPIESKDRGENDPIVIGGGPCTYNAEPVADFFDIFSIGEGEDALVEFSRLYINMKEGGEYTRAGFLHEAAKIPGFYVPSLYDVSYNSDGTVKEYTPVYDDIPRRVTKRIMRDMDKSYFPEKLVLPYIKTVQDRIMLEVYRGCIRGCRFCQAGMVYRPVREKTVECLNKQAKCLFESTGYDEISLSSLSISDYSHIDELTKTLLEWTDEKRINLSLPSLRLDSFTPTLMDRISSVRSSGLTFAPEAGTQRLRDVINKNVTEEDLMHACDVAFGYNKNSVKLYFMNGLPTETDDDIKGIADLAKKCIERYYQFPGRQRGRAPQVTVSVSCFIPKPFTAFQWEAQDSAEELERKQMLLAGEIRDKKIRYNWHGANSSRIEAVFARGDRKLCAAIKEAHAMGARFDSWDEFFDYGKWMLAFEKTGIDPWFYTERKREYEEVFPWDIIDCGVTKEFLIRENKRAHEGKTTPNCKEKCSGCGANRLGGERTWCTKTCE